MMLALTGGAGVCLLLGHRAHCRARACQWSVGIVDASVGRGDTASAEGSANVVVNLQLLHPLRAPAALPPLVLSQRLAEEDIAPIFSDTWTGSQVWPASVALSTKGGDSVSMADMCEGFISGSLADVEGRSRSARRCSLLASGAGKQSGDTCHGRLCHVIIQPSHVSSDRSG